jgi:hypothetical protein
MTGAVHTRACTEMKKRYNSVTVQNWTHVYMNIFDHKDLGNHFVQLCPIILKHPVCPQIGHGYTRQAKSMWSDMWINRDNG